jgi:hypothetical protein
MHGFSDSAFEYQRAGASVSLLKSHIGKSSKTNLNGSIVVTSDRFYRSNYSQINLPEGAVTLYNDIGVFDFAKSIETFKGDVNNPNYTSGIFNFDIDNSGSRIVIDYPDEGLTKIYDLNYETGEIESQGSIYSGYSISGIKSEIDGSGQLLVISKGVLPTVFRTYILNQNTNSWEKLGNDIEYSSRAPFSISDDGNSLLVIQYSSLSRDPKTVHEYKLSSSGWTLISAVPAGTSFENVSPQFGPNGKKFALLASNSVSIYTKSSGSWDNSAIVDTTISPTYFPATECYDAVGTNQENEVGQVEISADFSTIVFSDPGCDRALIVSQNNGDYVEVQELYGVGNAFGISSAVNIDGSRLFIMSKRGGANQTDAIDESGYFYGYQKICLSNCSEDSDEDGIPNQSDLFPNDPTEWSDADGDSVGDFSDNCPLYENPSQKDGDADSIGDVCDLDDDADGVLDFNDALPFDPNETSDFDNDGIGDNADNDDDNDGWNDDVDDFPYDSTEYLDSDGDGVGDNTDAFPNDASETVDSDGDGVGNNSDQFPNDNFESKDSDSDGYGDNLENVANSDKDSTRSQPEHFSVVANAVWTGLHAGFVPGRFETNGYSRSWMPTKTGFITLISYSPEYNLELGAQLGFRKEDVTIDSYCAGKGTYLLEYSKNLNEDTSHNLDVTKIDCSTNYNGNTVSNVKLVESGKRWYAVLKYSAFEIKIFEIDSITKKPTGEPFSYRIPKFGSDSGHFSSDFFDAIAHGDGIYMVSLNSTGRLLLSSVNLSTGAVSVEDKFIEPIIIKKNSGGGPVESLPEPLPESIYWTNVYPTKIGSNLGLIYAVAKASDDLEISPNLPNVYFLATYDKGLNLVSNEELIRVNEGEAIVCCDNMDGNKLSWTTGVAGYTVKEIVNGEEFENTFPSTIRQQKLSSLRSFSGRFDVNGHLTSAELFAYDEPQVEVYPNPDFNGAVYTKNYEGYNESNNVLAPINKHWAFDAGPAFVTMNMGITLTHLGVGTSPSNPSWGFSDRRFHQFASQAKESNEVKTQTYREFSYDTYDYAGDYELHHSVAEKVGTNDYWFLREESPPGGLYNVPAGASISSVSPALSVFEQTRYFKVTFPRYVNSASATISLAGDAAQYFEFDKTNMQIKVIGYPTIPTDGVGLIDKLFVTLSDDRITQQLEFVVVFEDTYRSPNVSPIYNLHDADKDGYPDNLDAFPNDVAESVDTDLDGIGNNDDPDDDNDGFTDEQELIDGTDPLSKFSCREGCASLDLDGSEKYDALTDGLLLLRGMFGLDGSALVAGVIGSNAAYTLSVDITARINALGSAADIDGNGEIDALTDGLLTLRYLFGLEGDTLINGVVAGDATRKTAEEIEAHLENLMPSL